MNVACTASTLAGMLWSESSITISTSIDGLSSTDPIL